MGDAGDPCSCCCVPVPCGGEAAAPFGLAALGLAGSGADLLSNAGFLAVWPLAQLVLNLGELASQLVQRKQPSAAARLAGLCRGGREKRVCAARG